MTSYVLLLRGINVGRAKRVAMADLRLMLVALGFGSVRTLLNSGNVVFMAPGKPSVEALTRTIAARFEDTFGFTSQCFVVPADDIAVIVRENTLAAVTDNPSRLMVVFLSDLAQRGWLEPLTRERWGREALAVGTHAVYLWCPESVLTSPLLEAVGRVLKSGTTMRNWATVLKVQAALEAPVVRS